MILAGRVSVCIYIELVYCTAQFEQEEILSLHGTMWAVHAYVACVPRVMNSHGWHVGKTCEQHLALLISPTQ